MKLDEFIEYEHSRLDGDNELLVTLLRSDLSEDLIEKVNKLSSSDWDSLIDKSLMHSVSTLIWERLQLYKRQIVIPEFVVKKMVNYRIQKAGRGIIIHNQLITLLTELKEKCIPVIILKGAHLAEIIYRDLSIRQMMDIDILVKEDDLARVDNSLLRIGYKHVFIDKTNPKRDYQFPYSPPKSGVRLEVHTSLRSLILPGAMDEKALWERAQSVEIGGIEALALTPEDLLLHLCYHVSYHLYVHFGLRSLVDISEIINYYGENINWKEIINHAHKYNITKCVFVALILVRKFLNTKIPKNVLAQLLPDDFNKSIIKWAESQIFMSSGRSNIRSQKIPELIHSSSIFKKVVIVIKGIFPSKGMIAREYKVKSDSIQIFYYYLVHIKDLIRRHHQTVRKLLTHDKDTIDITRGEFQRENDRRSLQEWFVK